MLLFLFLIIIEVLTFIVLRDRLRSGSKALFISAAIISFILSIWLWMLLFETTTYKGFFDNPEHISLLLSLTGAICAVAVPRIIFNLVPLHRKSLSGSKEADISDG